MVFSGLLRSSITTTTNPDPNGLSPKSPFPTPYVDHRTVAAAWTTQGATKCPALFPRMAMTDDGFRSIPIQMIPSGGSAINYTVKIWQYSILSNTWAPPYDLASVTFTGEATYFIDNPDIMPIFLQLVAIDSGSLTIYYDNGIAEAL